MKSEYPLTLNCPLPTGTTDRILLGHGGGGLLSHEFIEQRIRPLYPNREQVMHDSAFIAPSSRRLAFTTDSFVVSPLIFPGGDIGALSVHGTLNDLAMSGAQPEFLSLALIIEEGLRFDILDRVLRSIRDACVHNGVQCVTGDTKVVERGKGDGLFINTSGVGSLPEGVLIHPSRIQAGDAILVSGDLGRHGTAVMIARNHGVFQSTVESDMASLYPIVRDLLEAGIEMHCLRDLTRGGLAAALHELAQASRLSMLIDEDNIPVDPGVQSCCEILGLDAFALANEGRFVCILPELHVDKALDIIAAHPEGKRAARIGRVMRESRAHVILHSAWGTERILPMPSGELLPRIC